MLDAHIRRVQYGLKKVHEEFGFCTDASFCFFFFYPFSSFSWKGLTCQQLRRSEQPSKRWVDALIK